MKNIGVVSTIIGMVLSAIAVPAYAQSSVLQVPVESATGAFGAPVKVELVPGMGVNISLLTTGEKIEKVWLDNPSLVALDVDGCLKRLANQTECKGGDAQIIHLKLIEGLDFRGLPLSSTTLLTVVAKAKKERKVYIFEIVPSRTSTNGFFSTIEIVNLPNENQSVASRQTINYGGSNTNNSVSPVINVVPIIDIGSIEKGVTEAVQRELLVVGSPLWNRISDFIARIKAGQSLEAAASGAGISSRLVIKLQSLGTTTNSPTPFGFKEAI